MINTTRSGLRVVIAKPSKYGIDGNVDRFRRGFVPNATIGYLLSMTPNAIDDCEVETVVVDEYVQTNLDYLKLFHGSNTRATLLALVGVQSHQFQRSLDLAAYALANGVEHAVIGGPHPMTCDTSTLHGLGVSFALAEAEIVWLDILKDALNGRLQPVYGKEGRWQKELDAPALVPPTKDALKRYVLPMVGIYPARGCPFTCNFCSVIKIAGRQIRSQSIETTIKSLKRAKLAGIRMVIFTSDNFNKYSEAFELLQAMINERLNMPFFVQCDAQVAKQEPLLKKLAEAGCFQVYVGVESLDRKTLLGAHKAQNHPDTYGEIVRLCSNLGIKTHFSNIIGFPQDTRESIIGHLEELIRIAPDLTSFYVLTPIPGTEQYDEFMENGLITEPNLDRFDATCPTWAHPNLSSKELRELLFYCYRRFYSLSYFVKNLRKHGIHGKGHIHLRIYWEVMMPLFARYCACRRIHPLSGGVGKVNLKSDSVADFAELRKSRFGCGLLPLPASLALSQADAALNANVRL